MFNLTGKRALVTGSTQGIGYEIARVLRAYGAEVYIHCLRDEVKARAIAAELKSDLWVTGDLGDLECVKRIFEKTGALDIVVANASVQFRAPWTEISAEEFERQINVNLRSTLELMQAYIPAMQAKKWGRFLAVGSVQQYRPHMHMAVYAASKCAIQSLVHNVAKQVAKDGVTVNSLVPGVIATPRNNEALSDAEYAKTVLSGIPAGFAGQPSDCAGAALLLCSDAGRYITGIELPVDGGMKL